jgi:hypothetical protein
MSGTARIFLHPPHDTLARSIGTKEVSQPVALFMSIAVEHDCDRIGGVVRSIDPVDWKRRGVVPVIVLAVTQA